MLTETQKKAAKMLFENIHVQDVAKACGVHRCTIWRWSQTKDFKKEWTRLNRNYKRRLERKAYRFMEEQTELWKQKVKNLEEKVHETSPKEGKRPSGEFFKACNDYDKALFFEGGWDGKSRRRRGKGS